MQESYQEIIRLLSRDYRTPIKRFMGLLSIKVEVDRYVDKLSSSLDLLVNNLNKGGHEFWGFENYSWEQHELLIRKGVYPYEYMDSWNKFNRSLFSIDKFYINLNTSGISDGDYEHARKVWKEFQIKNMGEYHDLYLRTDVILLANVFESFRRVCLDNYMG